jgi:hypothetical protein
MKLIFSSEKIVLGVYPNDGTIITMLSVVHGLDSAMEGNCTGIS